MAQCEQCGRQLPPFSWRKVCRWCVQHEAAQRGENVAYQRVETAPWLRRQSASMGVTQIIFGINVAVFIGMTLSLGISMLSGPSGQGLVDWGANLGAYTVGGQWWRLLTSVFVHGSLLHIAFNMWCLWDLGRLAESVYGHWTFAVVYLLCGLLSSEASVAWHMPMSVPSVGASGAIFGIAGALLASFYLGEFSLPQAAISAMLRNIAIFIGANLFLGSVIPGIDNAAHVGGLIMGLILGALIARGAPDHNDIVRRIGVLLVGAVIIAGGIFWLQRSPLVGPGHRALARMYAAKKDYASAAAQWQRLIALNPRDENSYYQLGSIYLEQNAWMQARDTFGQLLKISQNNVVGHVGLGWAFSGLHQDAESLAEFQRAAAINPNYPGINFDLGHQLARLEKYDDALPFLLKQREIADDQDNENQLANVYTIKEMFPEATEANAKAEQLREQK